MIKFMLCFFAHCVTSLYPSYNIYISSHQTQRRSSGKRQSSSDSSDILTDQKKDENAVINKSEKSDTSTTAIGKDLEIPSKDTNTDLDKTPIPALPDIVNVQPVLSVQKSDNSILNSLADTISNLHINESRSSNLTVPRISYDAISSDEETFSECPSYFDQHQESFPVNESHQWHSLVLSNAPSTENLDNVAENADKNLKLINEIPKDPANQSAEDPLSANSKVPSEIEIGITEENDQINNETIDFLEEEKRSFTAMLETGVSDDGSSQCCNKTSDTDAFNLNEAGSHSQGSSETAPSAVQQNLGSGMEPEGNIAGQIEEGGIKGNSCESLTGEIDHLKFPETPKIQVASESANNDLNQVQEILDSYAMNETCTMGSALKDDLEKLTTTIDSISPLSSPLTLSNSSPDSQERIDHDSGNFNQTFQGPEFLKVDQPIENRSFGATEMNCSFDIRGEKQENAKITDFENVVPNSAPLDQTENRCDNVTNNLMVDTNEHIETPPNSLDQTCTVDCSEDDERKELATGDNIAPFQTQCTQMVSDNKINPQLANFSDPNNTFILSSNEQNPLNTTVDLTEVNRTFMQTDMNNTFNVGPQQHQELNKTINIQHQEKLSNTYDFQTVEEPKFADLNKPIAGTLDEDVEPMDVDSYSPYAMAPTTTKHIANMENMRTERQGIFVDNLTNSMDVTFKKPSLSNSSIQTGKLQNTSITESDFKGHGIILNPSDFDFDYLLSKGSNNVHIDSRNSLLLRFDPLLGHPVHITNLSTSGQDRLNSTVEEVQKLDDSCIEKSSIENNGKTEHSDTLNVAPSGLLLQPVRCPSAQEPISEAETGYKLDTFSSNKDAKPTSNISNLQRNKKNDKMSVNVIQGMKIANDTISEENKSPKSEANLEYKMDDLEKKIKNEVLKTEDIEKKLKDAEQREEAFLQRITEKDKIISKMSGVIEAYEKAIAELISEKEQIIQSKEKEMAELKAERDRNYQHLTSLEATFSDLHVKFERSKQLTSKLKASEEELKSEIKKNLENLRLQEERYDKMKSHALQQLEIASNRFDAALKSHNIEVTRLKALLKKEELARLSANEQLMQKTRENEELVKICDELINGQGASS